MFSDDVNHYTILAKYATHVSKPCKSAFSLLGAYHSIQLYGPNQTRKGRGKSIYD